MLGSLDQFRDFVDHLHQNQIKLIVDFVPNHTSTNHPWLKSHPMYYALDDQGEVVKEFSGDVCKLNYHNHRLQLEMIRVLKTISSWGVDGVRCDMAHLIPEKFWQQAVKQVRKENPDFLFIAESYESTIEDYKFTHMFINAGFDGIYHHALYQKIKEVISQNHQSSHVEGHIDYIQKNPSLSKHFINYIRNHDDHITFSSQDQLIQAISLQRLCPGIQFIYNGTLHNFNQRIAHHWTQILPDNQNEAFSIPQKVSQAWK